MKTMFAFAALIPLVVGFGSFDKTCEATIEKMTADKIDLMGELQAKDKLYAEGHAELVEKEKALVALGVEKETDHAKLVAEKEEVHAQLVAKDAELVQMTILYQTLLSTCNLF
jgi:hypothetical protein